LFHNANLFGSCIIQILYTGCAKIKKNNSGAKELSNYEQWRGLRYYSSIAEDSGRRESDTVSLGT
jgi:hypothetical protein